MSPPLYPSVERAAGTTTLGTVDMATKKHAFELTIRLDRWVAGAAYTLMTLALLAPNAQPLICEPGESLKILEVSSSRSCSRSCGASGFAAREHANPGCALYSPVPVISVAGSIAECDVLHT
jgi:hypothetical protein